MASNTQVDRITRHQVAQAGIERLSTGKAFYVHSGTGSDSGSGQDPGAPFATVDYAIGVCTADKGDVVYVMPGHNETITAATSLVMDIAGVSVIGLGRGASRPTFDYDNTAGTIEMDAASCRLSNVILRASVASAVVAINVDAADCEIDHVYFNWEATGDEFITCIDLDAVDRCHIHDCIFETEVGAGAATEAIRLDDTEDSIIENNLFRGTWTGATIANEGALCVRLIVKDNIIYNSDTSVYNGIDFGALSSTGIAMGNTVTSLYATTLTKLIRTGDMTWHHNTFVNAVSEQAASVTSVPAVTSV
jgi:hypothetical protein